MSNLIVTIIISLIQSVLKMKEFYIMRNYFLMLAMLIMSISITQPSFADDEITSNIIFEDEKEKSSDDEEPDCE